MNRGDGTFAEEGVARGLPHEELTLVTLLMDFDADGAIDVFVGNDQKIYYPDRLYRNDLHWDDRGAPRLRFVDVTERSRLEALGYGMGAAVGDVDNDGDPDLYVTNYGANQLWRNRGDGTFENATAKAGVGEPEWRWASPN